jgi:hypothetical protein
MSADSLRARQVSNSWQRQLGSAYALWMELWNAVASGKAKAAFTRHAYLKYFFFHLSHRIFKRMHEVLNVGKKITNGIVCL